MAALDPHLMSIFEAIVDDYDGQPPERRERLWHVRTFGEEGSNEWDSNQPRVSRDDLDDLHDAGLIDVDYNSSGDYLVKPTREGRSSLREVRREQTLLERSDPVDLTWAAVRPVLHAAVDEWTERGAPRSGYVVLRAIARRLDRDSDELALIRAVQQLAERDWLEIEYEAENEIIVRPTSRGISAMRGWPSEDGEVAAERLLSALDDLAQSELDATSRTWAARARDTLMEVGTKTLAEVVSKSVGTAV